MSIAIIRFPGSNCESESLDALHHIGVSGDIIEWNHQHALDSYSGFILPGGFSYQDRIRAGVVAAKLPILDALKRQSDTFKKPILGICNGAQILVESGIIGTSSNSTLDVIIDVNYTHDQKTNFISDWSFLTPFNHQTSLFLKHFKKNDVIPIQVCHGEGRFIFENKPTSGVQYCDIHGHITEHFPTTPNGSQQAIAGISNDQGNVFAIMPHPERSLNQQRYPFSIKETAKKNKLNLVDWTPLFLAFKES